MPVPKQNSRPLHPLHPSHISPCTPRLAAGAAAEAFTAAYAQEHTRLPHIIDLLSPGAHNMLGLPARDAVDKVAAVATHAADHGGWVGVS
jgi:hypothetical protein